MPTNFGTQAYADYAIALLDELEQPAHHHQRFVVAD
jgi:putative NADH-flavin reductase